MTKKKEKIQTAHQSRANYRENLEIEILETDLAIKKNLFYMSRMLSRFMPLILRTIFDVIEKDFGGGNPPAKDITHDEADKQIGQVPFNIARFEKAPCYLCGFGIGAAAGYYDEKIHPCAEFYHKAKEGL